MPTEKGGTERSTGVQAPAEDRCARACLPVSGVLHPMQPLSETPRCSHCQAAQWLHQQTAAVKTRVKQHATTAAPHTDSSAMHRSRHLIIQREGDGTAAPESVPVNKMDREQRAWLVEQAMETKDQVRAAALLAARPRESSR